MSTVNITVSNISLQHFLFVRSDFISVQLLTLHFPSRTGTMKKMDAYLILSLTALKKKKKSHFSYCSSLLMLFIILGLSSYQEITVAVQILTSFQVCFYSDFESDPRTTEDKMSMTSLESGIP